MADYRGLYETRSKEFDELSEQFTLFQDESNLMIAELEEENKTLKTRNFYLQTEIDTAKEKRKHQTNALEKQLEQIKTERNDFKMRFEEFQRKVIELENINEALESENRAANSMLSEYEQRVEKTMEELALLQSELEEKKQSNQEQVARLKTQLKQTEEQLLVLHSKHQKHNNESQQRRSRSRMSSSISSQDPGESSGIIARQIADLNDMTDTFGPDKAETIQIGQTGSINFSNLLNMDFKRNKETPAFANTIGLIENMISDLNSRHKNKPKTMSRIAAA